jgi:hypothetical protein
MPRQPATKRPANPSERQALSRERLKQAGGRVITIRLSANDAKDLDAIKDRFQMTTAEAIVYAIQKRKRKL